MIASARHNRSEAGAGSPGGNQGVRPRADASIPVASRDVASCPVRLGTDRLRSETPLSPYPASARGPSHARPGQSARRTGASCDENEQWISVGVAASPIVETAACAQGPGTSSGGGGPQTDRPITSDPDRLLRDLVDASVLVHIQDRQARDAKRLIKAAEFFVNGRTPGTAPVRCLGCWRPMDGAAIPQTCDECKAKRGVMPLRDRVAHGMPEVEAATRGGES